MCRHLPLDSQGYISNSEFKNSSVESQLQTTNWDEVPLGHIIKVKLHFQNEMPWAALNKIARDGLSWDNHVYDYFVCKDLSDDIYFIRRDEILHRGGITQTLRFQELKSLSLMATRLGLLCSNTCSGFVTESDVDIIVEDDITSSYNGQVTTYTDGSGFISIDIARKLPNCVIQGCKETIRCKGNTPAAFQVRILSVKYGLFKGTVVVDSALQYNTIKLRKSMLKVKPSDVGGLLSQSLVIIDIVNTCREPKSLYGSLNRHLVLMLHECGVPMTTFEDIIRYCYESTNSPVCIICTCDCQDILVIRCLSVRSFGSLISLLQHL